MMYMKMFSAVLVCALGSVANAADVASPDVLGLDVPIRSASAGDASDADVRSLPERRAVEFPLKDVAPGAYHLAVEVRSADVTGEDGKHMLGGYNFLLPKPLYQIAVGGAPVATQISCRSPLRLADDPQTNKPVYVTWLLSTEPVELKPGDHLDIQCFRDGGFVRRIVLLDEQAWEAEKMRSSDLPQARGDLGWGVTWFLRPPITRGYRLRDLDDAVKALELFSAGFAKPYIDGNPYASLVAEGASLSERITTYRQANSADAAAVEQGATLARLWQDYFTKVEQTLRETIPPVVVKIREALDFEKAGITLNEACAAGREAIFARDTARQYADGADEEINKLGDPNDLAKLKIIYLLTYADNAAEFAKTAAENAAKPQTAVEFPEYFVAALDAGTPATPTADASPRGEICLNGEWDFAINTGADNPPKPGAWPRRQRVPHGEWGYAINKGNIPDEQWLKQSRGYWDWWESSVWYHTEFDVPAGWNGRRFAIAFEEVEGYAEVFINGRYAGNHYTGLVPFEIDVTKHLIAGARNNILVFVERPSKTARPGSGYRYVTRPNLYPTRCLEAYFGGITGDVFLRSTPHTRIVDTYVRTWADRRIRVETTVRNDTDQPVDQTIVGAIRKDGKDLFTLPPQQVHLDPKEEKTVVSEAVWPDAQLWGIGGEYGSPDNLYYLVADLGGIDTTYTEFGFREMTIKGPDFYLNGKKILLQGDNFGAVGRDHQRRCRWYINQFFRVSREANITFTRAHQHSMCPDHAEIANRIGILLEPEACGWFLHPPSDIVNQRIDPELMKSSPPYANRAWEDPVWRNNNRDYYQTLVKRYRNDPSVAVFSTENEGMADVSADTIHQFNQWIKEVAPHLIVDCHSNGSVWDDRFEIANFHDYDVYVARMEEWAQASGPNHKPIVIGEFWNPTLSAATFHSPPREARAAEWAMAKWVERRFSEYITKLNASPMFFTFDSGSGALWSNGDPSTAGPWGDLIQAGTFKGIVDIDWPSLSGRGWFKSERFLAAPNTQAVNFCDPARVATTTTKVFEAFQKVYRDVPGWSNRRQPELIVTILKAGKPLPGVNVFLVPLDGQATGPLGVMADPNGAAWFITREPGRYAVQVSHDGMTASNDVTLECTEIKNRGGFDYIPRAMVDLDQPQQMAVARPKPTPLIRPTDTQSATSSSPLPDLPQGIDAVSADGFIRDWFVCGPFPSSGGRTESDKTGWDVDYLTATGGEAGTAPEPGTAYRAEFTEDEYAFWENAAIDVAWRRHVSPDDFIDLGKIFVRNDVRGLDFAPIQYVIGYVACTIDSPVDQDVRIAIGSDDGYKIYLNHALIAKNRVYRGPEKDQEKIDAHLKKGKNLLLVKVDQDIGGYGFFLRLLDRADNPLILPVANATPLIALEDDGWIRTWLICGPFANPGRGLNETTWNADYLTPHGGEAKINPAAGMKYIAEFPEDQTVRWTAGQADIAWRAANAGDDGFVDLGREFVTDQIEGLEFPPVENVLGYASTCVYCDQPVQARIEIDTINGVKVWLNHEKVFDKHVHRYNTDPASPNRTVFEEGNYYQDVPLNKGVNVLLLKLDVANGPYRFRCRFVGQNGQPVPSLRVGTDVSAGQ